MEINKFTNKPLGNKPEPPNQSVLNKNSGMGATKYDIKGIFRNMSDKTRLFGSHVTSKEERLRLAEELFPSVQYGQYIDHHDVEHKLKELKSDLGTAKFKRRNRYELDEIQDKISMLEQLLKK